MYGPGVNYPSDLPIVEPFCLIFLINNSKLSLTNAPKVDGRIKVEDILTKYLDVVKAFKIKYIKQECKILYLTIQGQIHKEGRKRVYVNQIHGFKGIIVCMSLSCTATDVVICNIKGIMICPHLECSA